MPYHHIWSQGELHQYKPLQQRKTQHLHEVDREVGADLWARLFFTIIDYLAPYNEDHAF